MRKVSDFFKRLKTPRTGATNDGQRAEQFAEDYLGEQGLSFIERNFFCKSGEIDLIFLDHHTIVFVEVRYRADLRHGSAAESITPSKLRKIHRSAMTWLQKNNKLANSCRFDAVLFDTRIDRQHLTWLKDIL
ncbi:YraN family protein [Marinomonas epiphytica]